MSAAPDQRLIVKHTFLELEQQDQTASVVMPSRPRSLTEPAREPEHGQSDSTSCGSNEISEEACEAEAPMGDAPSLPLMPSTPEFPHMPSTPEFSPLRYPCHSSQPALLQEESWEEFMPAAFTAEQIHMWQYAAGQYWAPIQYEPQHAHLATLGGGYDDGQYHVSAPCSPKHKHTRPTLPTIAEKEAPPVLPSKGAASKEVRTTVMLRGLPQMYTRSDLLKLLQTEGFFGRFNFVYVPIDFKRQKNLGYALVNLVSPAEAVRLSHHFEGFSTWAVPCDNVCEATWCNPHQGLQAHVERYRNSPVMHESVPEEWRPLILSHGVPVAFPAPTTHIKCPKFKGKQ